MGSHYFLDHPRKLRVKYVIAIYAAINKRVIGTVQLTKYFNNCRTEGEVGMVKPISELEKVRNDHELMQSDPMSHPQNQSGK